MTPLVLVHGFMGGSDQWALQAPLSEGRDVIAVDLPGFGKNAHLEPITSIPEFAQWVLDDVKVDQFDLLGHSMGGMIVQEMSRLAPRRIRKLVLYGTGSIGELPGRFEPIATSIERAQENGAEATANRISATWFLRREAAPQYPACARIARATTLPSVIAGLQAMQSWNGRRHLGQIGAPTLVLWGDGDRTYPWSQIETLWRDIPACQLAVVPACAHAVHMERPEIFNMLIAGFLGEQVR